GADSRFGLAPRSGFIVRRGANRIIAGALRLVPEGDRRIAELLGGPGPQVLSVGRVAAVLVADEGHSAPTGRGFVGPDRPSNGGAGVAWSANGLPDVLGKLVAEHQDVADVVQGSITVEVHRLPHGDGGVFVRDVICARTACSSTTLVRQMSAT